MVKLQLLMFMVMDGQNARIKREFTGVAYVRICIKRREVAELIGKCDG